LYTYGVKHILKWSQAYFRSYLCKTISECVCLEEVLRPLSSIKNNHIGFFSKFIYPKEIAMQKNNESWKEYDRFRMCPMPDSTDTVIEVSNTGRVRRLEYVRWNHRNGGYSTIKENYYSIQQNRGKKDSAETERKYGRYCHAFIATKYGSKAKSIHRLVATAFIPNPENKPQVNHINGRKDDNRVENLEWVTNKENALHAKENLRTSRKHLNFSSSDVEMAVQLYVDGYTSEEISEMLQIKTNRQSVYEVIAIALGLENLTDDLVRPSLLKKIHSYISRDSAGISIIRKKSSVKKLPDGKTVKFILNRHPEEYAFFSSVDEAIEFKKRFLKSFGFRKFDKIIDSMSVENAKIEILESYINGIEDDICARNDKNRKDLDIISEAKQEILNIRSIQ